ncbi:MAG: hypothetical protein NTV17_05425, partial [Burkholderiales bacterium]|nr:hypothetical protein [Burkholderiales bacterium]
MVNVILAHVLVQPLDVERTCCMHHAFDENRRKNEVAVRCYGVGTRNVEVQRYVRALQTRRQQFARW